jgi:hypothetical protein
MADAVVSEAARALSRVRWGSTRTDRLVSELAEQRERLTPQNLDVLRELAADDAGRVVSR